MFSSRLYDRQREKTPSRLARPRGISAATIRLIIFPPDVCRVCSGRVAVVCLFLIHHGVFGVSLCFGVSSGGARGQLHVLCSEQTVLFFKLS